MRLTTPAPGHDPAGDKPALRNYFTTPLLVAALIAAPAVAFAATQSTPQTQAAARPASTRPAATHATRGVVKSIDASTLVITRTDRHHAEMTFALNASTHREGTIAVGTPVSVRYREDGRTNVATAVRVQLVKQQAAHTTPSKR